MSARPSQSSTALPTLQSDVKLSLLLETVGVPIVIVDSQSHIILVNEMAEGLFGYSKGGLIGKPVEILFPPHLKPQVSGYFNSSHGAKKPEQASGRHHDGREFPIEIISRRLHLKDGTYSLNVIRDLTSQTSAQLELTEKTAALESARQEFQAFSHSISHDLRAPLRAMDGFAASLKRSLGENLSKESNHALNRIQENVFKMSRLIDGLLDYSALSWVAMTTRKIELGSIAKKSFDGIAATLNERHIDFSIGDLAACEADMALIRRVFDNLLSNAVKFTRQCDPAVIRVDSREEDGERVYFVQDNGVGFDMEYAEKLFRVFQRLHSPSEFEGTGMGLAIVHRIVQRHGGRVWAEAKVDGGATFYFTLGKSDYGHSA